MPGTYRIIPSDGNVANQITVEPLQTVSTTPLTFAGYRNPVYGEILWSDLYHLLENFASPTAPTDTKAVQGQLWFKKTSPTAGELYVRNSSTVGSGLNSWVKILTTADGSKCTVAATPPTSPVIGELWYDTSDEGRGFVWVGNGWIDFCPGGGGGGVSVTVAHVPPSSPSIGSLWYDTADEGRGFVWIGNGWVDFCPGGGGGGAFSDPRLKENVEKITDALTMVNALSGYRFTWKHGIPHVKFKAGRSDIGILANEVETILPELVTESIEMDGEKYKMVSYEKLVPVLIEAIKELQHRLAIIETK
jgi:hypothetical protein